MQELYIYDTNCTTNFWLLTSKLNTQCRSKPNTERCYIMNVIRKIPSLNLFTSFEFYSFIHLLICLSSCLSIYLSVVLSIHHSLRRKEVHRVYSTLWVVRLGCIQQMFAECLECFWNEILFVLFDVIKNE